MNIGIMVPLVSFLAALRILTEAQICNNGEGKLAYEKIISNQFNELHSPLSLSNSSAYSSISHEIVSRSALLFVRSIELPLTVITLLAAY